MNTRWVSALIYAVMNNQVTKVIRLLKLGADPNGCEDDLSYSPLHYAAAHGGSDMARVLLDAGADLEAKDIDGDTPLQTAWLHRNAAFIRVCQQRQLTKTLGEEQCQF